MTFSQNHLSHLAARSRNIETFKLLLEADERTDFTERTSQLPQLENLDGDTLFTIACEVGVDMVKILREAPYFAKLEYKRKQDGNTPLATACEEDNGDVVEYLLSEGDNSDENVGIHENNFYDRTPMLLSAREGSDDSIQGGFF